MAPRNRPPRHLPEHVLAHPEVMRACAERDLGRLFRVIGNLTVEPARFTATHIGVQCQMPTTRVQDYIRGIHNKPSLHTLERVADGLHIPGQYLGLTPRPWEAPAESAVMPTPAVVVGASLLQDEWGPQHTRYLADQLIGENAPVDASTAVRLAHEWLIADPPQVIESRSGRRIGDSLVGQIETRIHKLRQMDDFIGGADLHAAVSKELAATVTLVQGAAYDERIGRRLLAAVGELCQVAGWVASDAGYHATAERYYLVGTSAAHAAGNRSIAANLLSSLSYQVANVGDPRKAAVLARTAVTGIDGEATPAIRALLWERVAWAEAKTQESKKCERALDSAAQAFSQSDPKHEPRWIYWLNKSEIDIMAGRCYTELSRPLRAEPLLRRAIESYDESHARESALYLTWLADDYIQAREIEEACIAATRAVQLAGGVRSARTTERIAAVRAKLEPFSSSRAVLELDELLRQTRSTTVDGPD